MSEQFSSLSFLLIVLIPVGVFIRQIQHVRHGMRGKARGTLLFFCFSLVPVLAYALVFLVLIGIEKATKHSLIGEGFARASVLVVGIGVSEVVLLTGVFAIAVSFLRPAKNAT
jgi:hypothetical protein